MKKIFTICALLIVLSSVKGQNTLTYAGGSGRDVFYDVVQLSNGKYLVAGSTESLDWINVSVPRTILTTPTPIANALGGGEYSILLLLDSNLLNIEQVVHFPLGAAENFRFIRTTNIPLQITGDLFVSGQTEDSRTNGGGFFIAKLNNNFVTGVPTACSYLYNNWAEGRIKESQPWDVSNDGEVTFTTGQAYAADWAAVHRLNTSGVKKVVPEWRRHWTATSEFFGIASSYAGPSTDMVYSGIVMKQAGRCDLRSTTLSDFNYTQADENGGTKKGKWPMDFLFSAPCDPLSVSTSGPGYNGYRMTQNKVPGATSLTIDRRNNDLFMGWNMQTLLPDGQPDYEPAVMKMNSNGGMVWWSRLYHEIQPDNDTVTSTPDQYVDAIAIDYSLSGVNAEVVILARSHGNNVENLWEGNTVAANPTGQGFQNQFTGAGGNFHLSWIGKMKSSNGQLQHSTYLGEQTEGNTSGTPFASGLMQGWYNPNTGWPVLNDTRMSKNSLKVTADGSVIVSGTGRRTITTSNAHQQNLLPGTGVGSWNSFIRQYTPDLSTLTYSTILTGTWNASGVGGDNTKVYNVFKTRTGIVAVGEHTENGTTGVAGGNPIPVANVPAWGTPTATNRTGIFAHFKATNLVNTGDNPVSGSVVVVNTAPTAGGNSTTTNQGNPVTLSNIIANDSDAEGALIFSSIDMNTTLAGAQTTFTNMAGTWVLNTSTGEVTFTPISTFSGTATMTYSICDGGNPALCTQANLTVTVNANNAPTAGNNSTSTNQGIAVTFTNILSNDSDVEGPLSTSNIDLNLTVTGIQTSFTNAAGTWVVNPLTGEVTFTPIASFTGMTMISYTICDNGTPVLCADGQLTVTVVANTAANDAPVASDNATTTNQGTAVVFTNIIANDTDPDNILLTSNIDLDPTTSGIQTTITTTDGTWTVNPLTGEVTFVPNASFVGTTSIAYQICDGESPSLCDIGLLTVTVNAINTTSIEENQEAEFILLAYPNPTNGDLNVIFEGLTKVSVFTMDGALVYVSNFINKGIVPMELMARGSYIIEAQNEKALIRRHIVKL